MSSSRAYPSFAICNGFDGTLSFGDGDTDGAVYREKAVEERCVKDFVIEDGVDYIAILPFFTELR